METALRSRWLTAGFIVAGAFLRLLWWGYSAHFGATPPGEALNVARAIYSVGSIAAPFRPDQGPTAHLMPIPPMIAAGVYHLFGYETFGSGLVLTLWSVTLALGAFLFFDVIFARLGSPILARRLALAVLCILPLNFSLEVLWFRVWDGGLAVACLSVLLLLLVRWDGQTPNWSRIACLALALAVMFFVQPNIGVAAVAAMAVFAWRNIAPRNWPVSLLIVLVAGGVVFAPWVIRNEKVLGSPILLRDNLGLEMALAFHDGAITGDPRQAFFLRHKEIHPFEDGNGYAAMQQAGGEVAYAKRLGTEAKAWMLAHPVAAARLAVEHLIQVFLPPLWFWTMFSDVGSANGPKMVFHWAISILGLLGLGAAFIRRDWRYIYPALFVLVTPLPFMLVQPTLRYRYLIFPLLVFFAAEVIGRGRRLFATVPETEARVAVPPHAAAAVR